LLSGNNWGVVQHVKQSQKVFMGKDFNQKKPFFFLFVSQVDLGMSSRDKKHFPKVLLKRS